MNCWLQPKSLFAAAMVVAMVLSPVSVLAQGPKTVFMVLWRGETEVEKGFRAHFEEAGLPLDIIVRSINRDRSKIPEILEEIEEVDPDLVYSWGTSVTLGIAGKHPDLMDNPDDWPAGVTDRPVVFTMVSQPVRSRIIKRFGPTGRNVTGVSHIVPLETQFEAMQAYMPINRIAVIFTPTEPNSVLAVEQLRKIGEGLNVRVDRFPVPLDSEGHPDPAALPNLVIKAASRGPQVLYLGPDSFIGQYTKELTQMANSRRLPSFASVELMLSNSDALFGLVAPYDRVGRFTASKVEKILFGGEDVGDVPVEVLPEFSYLIRADVARELKIFPRLSLMDYARIIDP